jgi:hypothetical protein
MREPHNLFRILFRASPFSLSSSPSQGSVLCFTHKLSAVNFKDLALFQEHSSKLQGNCQTRRAANSLFSRTWISCQRRVLLHSGKVYPRGTRSGLLRVAAPHHDTKRYSNSHVAAALCANGPNCFLLALNAMQTGRNVSDVASASEAICSATLILLSRALPHAAAPPDRSRPPISYPSRFK